MNTTTTNEKKMTATERRIADRNHQIEMIKNLERNKNVEVQTYKNLIYVTFEREVRTRGEGMQVKPFLTMWRGTQANPFSNYYYTNIFSRQRTIEEEKKREDYVENYEKERKAERAAFKHHFKVGDILSSSWGYEQTNVDFYEVVGLFGKFGIELRQIASELVEDTGPDQGIRRAIKGEYIGELIRKQATYGNSVRIDRVRSARLNEKGEAWCSWYY